MKKNKVIYIVQEKLHGYPPCISQIVMLQELGIDVYAITKDCDKTTENIIKKAGAEIEVLKYRPIISKNRLWKLFDWISFRRAAVKGIKKNYEKNDIIWCGTEGTGIVLDRFLKGKKVVLNVLELSRKEGCFGKIIGRTLKYPKAVVACELNRARIMKMWYKLDRIPFVMPNKPYYEIDAEKSTEVIEFQRRLKDKKYILYQGILNPERPLDTIAEALKKTKEHYTLVIIGSASSKEVGQDMINHLRSVYQDIIWGGYFGPPQHLYITQNAAIGIAIYDTSSLNTIFCAPNKIFEYAKYNVPIIGNDIPGLQLTVEKHNAGVCVDIDDVEQITKAIDKIAENYGKYRMGTTELYNSVDNMKVMKQIVSELGLL